MSQKRTYQLPDIYKKKKRICLGVGSSSKTTNQEQDGSGAFSDTKGALLFLRDHFPSEKFDYRLPPLILEHQIYSVMKDRTAADKQLNDMRIAGEIKMLKLPTGAGDNEYCVLFTNDYKSHVLKISNEWPVFKEVVDMFLNKIALTFNDVSITKQTLCEELKFRDEDISELLRAGLLAFRDVNSWWLALPNASMFMTSFIRGRKTVLTMIRKSKYREVLQKELEQRNWPKQAKLGVTFHIHDIIGANLVHCIPTTSGKILRLKEG